MTAQPQHQPIPWEAPPDLRVVRVGNLALDGQVRTAPRERARDNMAERPQ